MAYKQKFVVFLLIGMGFTVQGVARLSQLIVYSNLNWFELIYSSFTLIVGFSVLFISRDNFKKMRKNKG
ncbi:hypothetical protein ABNX05_08995 [Lysinibacillus sp. M3]|uniref:DUF3955 domain-containing protein n=1 Tax=Lysinibacillus zambalensis TaxID=3160866 RepID=A0ABV1MQI0_9BACI